MIERPADLRCVTNVDPFLGCEAAVLPEPSGIAATWWCAKPPIGNTHPGATLPFGMVSACAYSGGYVTGYGPYGLSLDGGPPPIIFPTGEILGIAHFQQSGTGRIRTYYNYLLTTPLGRDGLSGRTDRRKLVGEQAWPGFYGGNYEEGILFGVTVTPRGAVHCYEFPDELECDVVIDVSSGGLRIDDMGCYPQGATITVVSESTVVGTVVMEGIPLHFKCVCENGNAYLWEDEEWLDHEVYELTLERQKVRPTFGFGFRKSEGKLLELSFGFSVQTEARAAAAVELNHGFKQDSRKASELWESNLHKIEVKGGTEDDRQVFLSALYHALLKPADLLDENPFTKTPGPFFVDLSTLWDLYKTQLPLLMTLYPERGARFVEFLCEVAHREGGFPISYLLDNSPDRFTKQATGLCHSILEDARLRGIEGDWDRVLSLLWRTSQSGKGRRSRFGEYGRKFVVDPLSHTLDIAYAHFCMSRMARSVGHQVIYDKTAPLAEHWRNAFDSETGLLRQDSTYYEGENWNYSFRLLHDMESRIEIAGGAASFIELLDKFFGFSEVSDDERIFRFEGLNNEPDMEAPFAYLYAGRHDRTAEVVRRVMQYQFTTGRGGLPGNDDSGGLSSWFVWNATGLFPVCGQPVMLIGSPLFDAAVFNLEGGQFTVKATDNSAANIYVQSAEINGRSLGRAWLKIGEFAPGNLLTLQMGPEPSDFGDNHLPPSFAS